MIILEVDSLQVCRFKSICIQWKQARDTAQCISYRSFCFDIQLPLFGFKAIIELLTMEKLPAHAAKWQDIRIKKHQFICRKILPWERAEKAMFLEQDDATVHSTSQSTACWDEINPCIYNATPMSSHVQTCCKRTELLDWSLTNQSEHHKNALPRSKYKTQMLKMQNT